MADILQNPEFRSPGFMEWLHSLMGGERPLETIQVEVTTACTGRCVYCPHTVHAAAWRSRHMEDAVFATLWSLFRRARRAHLQGWGEPLLHPRFFDYVAFARRAGCAVSSTSCGLHMDAATARSIARSGMDVLAFSFAGTDAASNQARAGVPFDAVCRAIDLVHAAGREGSCPDIHLAYLLLADRIDAAARLPGLMEALDVQVAVVSTLDYLALPEQAHLAFAPHEHDKIAHARAVLEAARDEAARAGRDIIFALPGSEACAGGCREQAGASLYASSEGALSPCVYLNIPADNAAGLVFGNVQREDGWNIWQSREFASFRSALARGAPQGYCRNCPKRFETVFEPAVRLR